MIQQIFGKVVTQIDETPIEKRKRVVGFIEKETYNNLFHDWCSFHGCTSRIVSALTQAFGNRIKQELEADPTLSPQQVAIDLINELNQTNE